MQHFSTSSYNLSDLKAKKYMYILVLVVNNKMFLHTTVHKVSMEFSIRENKSLQFYVPVTIRQDKFQYKAQLIDTKNGSSVICYLETNISTASALSGWSAFVEKQLGALARRLLMQSRSWLGPCAYLLEMHGIIGNTEFFSFTISFENIRWYRSWTQ